MPRERKKLADLAALRETLAQKARDSALQQQRDQAERDREHREANVFRDAIGDVAPLRRRDRIEHAREPHAPQPRQRHRDNEQVLAEAMSDQFEVDALLHADESLSWSAPGIGADILRKLRSGAWKLQAELDLHGLRVDEAREQIGQFLRDAGRRGLRCVRVIHGKGLGSRGREPVLRDKVRRWLAQRNEVIAFCQARPAEGGAGALLVLLRASGARAEPK
jgi:DNA-nicking Smr family endonuclease